MKWACSACTYENDGNSLSCTMCGTQKQLHSPGGTHQGSRLTYEAIIDCVQNYLNSAEWRNLLTTFISTHCAIFADIEGEHDHGQHQIFQEFRTMVDGMVDGVLNDVGSTVEEFIEACEVKLQQPDQGPRDAALKALLTQLLTFEDFMLFQKMMHDKNLEAEAKEYGATNSHSSFTYHQNSSPTANWACSACTYMNGPSLQTCEYCHVARYGTSPQRNNVNNNDSHNNNNNSNDADDPNLRQALLLSVKDEKRRKRQEERERQQMAMVKEASLRQHSSSRNNDGNNHPNNRNKSKEERDMELAMRESLRMSSKPSNKLTTPMRGKKSLVRLSSEEQMQSFKKASKLMSPQMLRQLVPVTADRGIRSCFDQYDQTRTGVVSKDEFARMIYDFGFNWSDRELREALEFFDDHNNNCIELIQWYKLWSIDRDDSANCDHTINRLCDLRKEVGIQYNVFFGFSYDEWKSASNLKDTEAKDWGEREVMKWFAFNQELKVVRSSLRREALEEIDGETLLGLQSDDVLSIGVKKIHVAKVLRVVGKLREKCGLTPLEENRGNYYPSPPKQQAPTRLNTEMSSNNSNNSVPPVTNNATKMDWNDIPATPFNVLAISDYFGSENDLDMKNGDLISVEDTTQSDEWWFGQSRRGEGYFPVAYVTLKIHRSPKNSAKKRINKESDTNENVEKIKSKEDNEESRSRTDLGEWRKGEIIGKGAYGTVYMGLNLQSGEMMAVKQIATNSDPEELKDLQDEINVMKKLSHKHIVSYLGAQWDGGTRELYIFTEWVPAGSLVDILKKFGRLTESIARTYTKQILLGLKYLHDNDVIHLDIKPGNVLINDLGTVKLADFGAARQLTSGQSISKKEELEFRGTPYFMAPELIRQEKQGRKADIWSVGGTVLNMFTGNPPWSSKGIDTAMALMFYISNADSPPTEEYPDNASLALVEFLNRCFDFNEETRPTTDQLLQFSFMFDDKQTRLDNSNVASLTRHGSEALAQHIAQTEQQQNSLSKQESNYRGDEVPYDVFDYSSDEEEDIEDVANFIQRQVSDGNAMSVRMKVPLSPNPFARGNIFSNDTEGDDIAERIKKGDV